MPVETALGTRLNAVSAVTDIVSTRIYNSFAPNTASEGLTKNANPYITYHQISDPGHHHMTGGSDIASTSFQIDGWARTTAARTSIKEALRTALEGFSGTVGSDDIRFIFLNDRGRDSEEFIEGSSRPIFRTSIDATVWHAL